MYKRQVEDETAILRGLIDLFVYHGFEVASSQDGQIGLNMAIDEKYDCIILDVMLPGLDGFSICNAIRKKSRDQPIVMLTAKSSEDDIIHGLTLGADDYISKPFSVHELVLRVKSLLRRHGWINQSEPLQLADDIEIDAINLTGQVRGKKTLFTRREIDILQYLKRNQRPVQRKELLSEVWGYKEASGIDTRTVDIHIAKLRKKIEADIKTPTLLVTFRGEGYKLMPYN